MVSRNSIEKEIEEFLDNDVDGLMDKYLIDNKPTEKSFVEFFMKNTPTLKLPNSDKKEFFMELFHSYFDEDDE